MTGTIERDETNVIPIIHGREPADPQIRPISAEAGLHAYLEIEGDLRDLERLTRMTEQLYLNECEQDLINLAIMRAAEAAKELLDKYYKLIGHEGDSK